MTQSLVAAGRATHTCNNKKRYIREIHSVKCSFYAYSYSNGLRRQRRQLHVQNVNHTHTRICRRAAMFTDTSHHRRHATLLRGGVAEQLVRVDTQPRQQHTHGGHGRGDGRDERRRVPYASQRLRAQNAQHHVHRLSGAFCLFSVCCFYLLFFL